MKRANDQQVTVGRVFRQLVLVGGLVISVLLIAFIIYPWRGWVPSVLIFIVMAVMLVRAYSTGHRYRCANCGWVFRVPVAVDFFTGGGIGKNPDGTYHNWKSLTCPECGQRSRAVVVRVVPGDEDATPDSSEGKPDAERPAPSAKSGRRDPNAKRRRAKRS
jgi:rubredoxin